MKGHKDIKDFDEVFETLQELDECDWIEAKEYRSKLGKSFLETVSAFSNEPDLGGGYILMGVKCSADGSYVISGVDDPDDLQQQILSQCKQELNEVIVPIIKVKRFPEGNVVMVYIPEAEQFDKPIYLGNKSPRNAAYRRVGSSNSLCSRLDLKYLNKDPGEEYDLMPMKDLTIDCLDSEAINEYRRLRGLIDPSEHALKLDDIGLLKSLRAIVEHEGQLRPTAGGFLLFGNEEILAQHLSIHARVQYMLLPGTRWKPTADRRYTSVEFHGPLVLTFDKILSSIMGDILKVFTLAPDQVRRIDVPIIPRAVIREALCNALMHRDYEFPNSLKIIKYANRIDFQNPGYSLKGNDVMGEPGSILRNGMIVDVFRRLGFAEVSGTGVRMMNEAMVDQNFPIPIIRSSRTKNLLSCILLPEDLADENNKKWLSLFKDYKLTNITSIVLILMREFGGVYPIDLQRMYDVKMKEATKFLMDLVDLGLVRSTSNSHEPYYVPEMEKWNSLIDSFNGEKSMPSSAREDVRRSGFVNDIELLPASLVAEVNKNSLALLLDIAKEIQDAGQRPPYKVVRGLIHRVCSIQPFTANQLASLFKKNPIWLRMNYLKRMVDDTEISMIYPDLPNHHKQAYFVKQKS